MQNDVYGSDTFYFIYCGISTWPTTVLLNSSDTSTPVLPQRTSIKNALLSFFHNLPRLLPAPIISDLNLVRNMPTCSQKGLDEHAPVKMKSIVLRPSAPRIATRFYSKEWSRYTCRVRWLSVALTSGHCMDWWIGWWERGMCLASPPLLWTSSSRQLWWNFHLQSVQNSSSHRCCCKTEWGGDE